MPTKIISAAVLSICFALMAWSSAAHAATVLTVSGEGSTNSLNATTTLGSTELKIKGKGQGTVKLTCGILGQLQTANPDGSFTFQHTVACDDHSLFVLNTRTAITVQGSCPGGAGIVGTFREESILTGVAGPFAGSTGKLETEGTINCGFNEFKITGTVTRP